MDNSKIFEVYARNDSTDQRALLVKLPLDAATRFCSQLFPVVTCDLEICDPDLEGGNDIVCTFLRYNN